MLQANRDKLEKYREKYNTLVKDQYLNLSPEERAEIIGVIRAEWLPAYTVMEWCGSCVVDMMKLAFRMLDENKQHDIHTPNSNHRRKRNN
jgi:hypothetical protein